MVFDLALVLVGITSGVLLWHRISQKIPELVAIPDEVIVHRLHEDSARIRVILLGFRRAWREREHHQVLLRYSERALYRAHIFILRADNGMVVLLKKIRAVLDTMSETNGAKLAAEREAETPKIEVPRQGTLPAITPIITPTIIRQKSHRVQEVRRKRTVKSVDVYQNAITPR